jgi:azurin
LPRNAWTPSEAAITAESILAWAQTLPGSERASRDYLEIARAGNELTAVLPAEAGAPIRNGLRDLSVPVFILKTVREQMRYDSTRLVVEAGKPFQIIFENNDFMPHNLVIVTPGSRTAIGEMAQTMPFTPDSTGSAFVPNDPRVLKATKLLEPGETETLKMDAPSTPGEYVYVCTYPGHWMVMYGSLIVTADIAQALAETPPDQPAAVQHHLE